MLTAPPHSTRREGNAMYGSAPSPDAVGDWEDLVTTALLGTDRRPPARLA
ncbi:hypothetical protein GTY20_18475, partial [Streptomyces sp. SID4946]